VTQSGANRGVALLALVSYLDPHYHTAQLLDSLNSSLRDLDVSGRRCRLIQSEDHQLGPSLS
jgi:hypothetical protein